MLTVTGTYSVHVNPAPPPPLALTPASGALPDETVGAAVTGTIAISGGTPPYTLGTAQGLPPGVSAAIDGSNVVLSGSPTNAGDGSVVLTVNDSTP